MSDRKYGFCERLAKDKSGNALGIVTAAVFPLMAAIGGGVDLTRAYMAQSRLAQTCDAAVLAGRKVMRETEVDDGLGTTTYLIDSAATVEIDKFIDFNFPDGTLEADRPSWTHSIASDGELSLTMTSEMPGTVAKMVGMDSIDLKAECSAKRAGANVDIVMVLDVTGSMAYSLSGGSCTYWWGGTKPGCNTRIEELQEATKAFLGVIDELRDQVGSTNRIRVSLVPYSTTVNIGRHLYAEDTGYIKSTGTKYYSKNNSYSLVASSQSCRRSSGWSGWSYYTCDVYTDNGDYGEQTFDLSPFVQRGFGVTAANHPHLVIPSSDATWDTTTTTGKTYNVSGTFGWEGCVEMRQTLTTIDQVTSGTENYSMPSGAYDINQTLPGGSVGGWQPYFHLPSGDNDYGSPSSSQVASGDADYTLWNTASWATPTPAGQVPFERNYRTIQYNDGSGWDDAIEARGWETSSAPSDSTYQSDGSQITEGPNYGCPRPVIMLGQYTRTDLTSYIDNLTIGGYTYHDAGMYWAVALVDSVAPFAQATSYNGLSVARHIVFMTDGTLEPNENYYTAWGIENGPTSLNNHTTTDGDSSTEHRKRFLILCEYAKNNAIEISTVAFSSSVGSADQSSLQTCASSDDNYYLADQTGELQDAFTAIAQNIGYLRISR